MTSSGIGEWIGKQQFNKFFWDTKQNSIMLLQTKVAGQAAIEIEIHFL